MEKLALEVFDRDGGGSKFAFLPSDTRIHITETSELFDSGDIWSHEFKLNIPANAHIFGTSGELHGSRLHDLIDKRRARLWILSLPVFYGYLHLDDEVDVDSEGNIDISIESGRKTFRKMVDGVKANQVPLMDDILIGMALKRERKIRRRDATVRVFGELIEKVDGHYDFYDDNMYIYSDKAQDYPKYVRPDGTFTRKGTGQSEYIDTVNKTYPYDRQHPYCNTRICYTRYCWEYDNNNIEKKKKREYTVSEPRRINPSPNFYVLYWIDCLMKHLGISVVENQALGVDGLRRLFFFNTKCAYDETRDDVLYTGARLPFESANYPEDSGSSFVPVNTAEEHSWELEMVWKNGKTPPDFLGSYGASFYNVGIPDVQNLEDLWYKAYATRDNFPNVDIEDVINSLENAFGIRFLFNSDYTSVRIILLRDVLRSGRIHKVPCKVLKATKRDNNIRGFRVTYGADESDTSFYYKGFADLMSHKTDLWPPEKTDTHDYGKWDDSLSYEQIKAQVGTFNNTCYIDKSTGNSYIIKIDENFKNASDESYPSLFECAQFMDAEDGDCNGDEATIKEIQLRFSPAIANTVSDGYAVFVDVDMEPPADRRGDEPEPDGKNSCRIGADRTSRFDGKPEDKNGLYQLATMTYINTLWQGNPEEAYPFELTYGGVTYWFGVRGKMREGYSIYLNDNYEVATDSPLDKKDFGLMFGVMRGSGEGSGVKYETDANDGEGNDAWDLMPGIGAYAHHDTCDNYGNVWNIGGNNIQITSQAQARAYLPVFFPDSNVDFFYDESGNPRTKSIYAESFRTGTKIHPLVFFGYSYPWGNRVEPTMKEYNRYKTTLTEKLRTLPIEEVMAWDRSLPMPRIISIESIETLGERKTIFMSLHALAIEGIQPNPPVCVNQDGIGYVDDDVSLKLRSEKPNPFFDASQPESDSNPRYMHVTNQVLSGRGLADKFHREESHWWRNAKTGQVQCQMEYADLLTIDKTERQEIGDITGFIKKIEYDIDIQYGLGDVDIEMWYL